MSALLHFRISPCAAMSEWWRIYQKCEWVVFDGTLWRETTYTSGWKDWMRGFIVWVKVFCCCCFFKFYFFYMLVNGKDISVRSILMEQTFRITAEERSFSWQVSDRDRVANLVRLHRRFGLPFEHIPRTLQALFFF